MVSPTPRGIGRAVEIKTAGFLYLVGATITVSAIALPHSAQANLEGFFGTALVMALVAVVLLGWSARLPSWIPQASMFLGTGLVTSALLFSGERQGGPAALNEMLYGWIALYSGYFFTRRQTVVQMAFVGASYAAALAAIDPGPIAVTRWLITVGMAATAAGVVRALKEGNDRLLKRLSDAACTDALTGLLNRQGFDERFELELERARRSHRPLALLLCDLDEFKAVNDRFGHPAGDAALKQHARLLSAATRTVDAAARVGGDEFALLLPATTTEGAFDLAERLRAQRTSDPSGRRTTMSFGAASFPVHGVTAEELLHAANRALYGAKHPGGDRTVVHPDPSSLRAGREVLDPA